MKKTNSTIVFFIAFIFSLGFSTFVVSFTVKADAIVKVQPGVTLKSANLSTGKVIKVPEKSSNYQVNARLRGLSLSRGGSASRGSMSVVAIATQFMGKPYVWGASGPRAFDCSGFTAYVYKAFGIALPHYTGSQIRMGQAVKKSNLAAGDLVFFNTDGPVSHVGIYIGGGQFIHASSGSHRVTVSELNGSYYAERYAGARRILK